MNTESLHRIARAMVEHTTQKYMEGEKILFTLMLEGGLKYELEAHPGSGHDFNIILNEIYSYYKENPNIPMDKIFYNSLLRSIELSASIKDLNLNMSYIFAQLENEKRNIAPFKINVIGLLKQVKDSIQGYEKLHNDPRIDGWIKSTNEALKENYGHKIL